MSKANNLDIMKKPETLPCEECADGTYRIWVDRLKCDKCGDVLFTIDGCEWLEKIRANERERCAKIAESFQFPTDDELTEEGWDRFEDEGWSIAAFKIAEKIRGNNS